MPVELTSSVKPSWFPTHTPAWRHASLMELYDEYGLLGSVSLQPSVEGDVAWVVKLWTAAGSPVAEGHEGQRFIRDASGTFVVMDPHSANSLYDVPLDDDLPEAP